VLARWIYLALIEAFEAWKTGDAARPATPPP
jgi:hypothetical protein